MHQVESAVAPPLSDLSAGGPDAWDDADEWEAWLARPLVEPAPTLADLIPDALRDAPPAFLRDEPPAGLRDREPATAGLDHGDPVADVWGRSAEWPTPALLDGTVPGPLLATLAAEVDLGSCSDDAVVGVASASARLQAWAAALELEATAALVRRAGSWRGVSPAGRPVAKQTVAAERICAAELAAALGLSERAAAGRVALAQDLRRLPTTRAALAKGELHLPTARMVVDTLRPLDDDTAAAVEGKVVPRYAGRCYGDVSRALRRAVLAADPAAAEKRRERGVADRKVETWALPDGMATAAMTGPAEDVETLVTFATAGAEAAKAPGDDRTIDQRRFDFLADLARAGLSHDTTRPDLIAAHGKPPRPGETPGAHGEAGQSELEPDPTDAAGAVADAAGPAAGRLPTRQGRRPHIQVVVSVETLLGESEAPGELLGYGPITAETARRIAADGTWRRLLTDPRTGRFDELSVETYEPPQDMRDHVIARDPTCIGLGCRLPASRCDLDHRIEYPRGPTAAHNLDPWCRSGHEIKTFTDTDVVIDPAGDGGRIVTYPTGRSYRLPVDPVLEHVSPDPVLPDLDVRPF